MDLAHYLRSRGGFATRAQLTSAGIEDRALREAVRGGTVQRVRKGWYAAFDAHEDAIRAVRAGGRLACVSALSFAGAWTMPGTELHVAVDPHGRSPSGPGVRAHGGALRSPRGGHPAIESPLEALERLSRCGDARGFVVAADSALNRGLVTLSALTGAVGGTVRGDRLLAALDAKSESGIESLARLALRRAGVRLRSQVVVDGVGRVDLLIGDRLVLELDGRAWHEDAFERDRRRDLALAVRGYHVVRVSYNRVMRDWDQVQADLLVLIRRGDHLR